MQENSHHSYADGINKNNLIHDTRIDRVLISFHYWYFGENAIELPKEFTEAIATGRAYKKLQNNICADITSWVGNYYEMGQHGLPYKWKKFGQFVRFEGRKAMIINTKREGLKKTKVYDTYWKFACERQNIFMRKLMGEKDNLTEDIILREYKFTNTYRASDRVSQYLIKKCHLSKRVYRRRYYISNFAF